MIVFLKALCVGTIFAAMISNMYHITAVPVVIMIQLIAIGGGYYFFRKVTEIHQKERSMTQNLLTRIEGRIQSMEQVLVSTIEKTTAQGEALTNKQLEQESKIWEENQALMIKHRNDLNKQISSINDMMKQSQSHMLEQIDKQRQISLQQNEQLLVKLDELAVSLKNELNKMTQIKNDSHEAVKTYLASFDESLHEQKLAQQSLEKMAKNIANDSLKLVQLTNKTNGVLDELYTNEEASLTQLKMLLKGIANVKGSITDSVDMVMEKTEELTDDYKNTQTYIMSQLAQVSESNKAVVDLLMDNYKVLDAIINK